MRLTCNIITLIIISAITLSVASCIKSGGPCEEPLNINLSSISVSFTDQTTGKFLYAEVNPLYNKDSLNIFDPFGTQLILLTSLAQIPNTNSRYWEINFGNLYNSSTDPDPFISEVCKNFIVQYNSVETDTIRTCFKAKKTKCGSVFEMLEVYHKDSLLTVEHNDTGAVVTITKN